MSIYVHYYTCLKAHMHYAKMLLYVRFRCNDMTACTVTTGRSRGHNRTWEYDLGHGCRMVWPRASWLRMAKAPNTMICMPIPFLHTALSNKWLCPKYWMQEWRVLWIYKNAISRKFTLTFSVARCFSCSADNSIQCFIDLRKTIAASSCDTVRTHSKLSRRTDTFPQITEESKLKLKDT